MKLFIDTNIVLDYLEAREKGPDAKKVFELAENGEEYECVTASSATDILYLLTDSLLEANKLLDEDIRKTKREVKRDAIAQANKLFSVLHILPVTENDIKKAFSLGWDDGEDALQYVVAKSNGVDIIITNNVSDYKLSDVPVMNAKDFLVLRKNDSTK